MNKITRLTRPLFHGLLGAALLLAGPVPSPGPSSAHAATGFPDRPNIVVIMVDDLDENTLSEALRQGLLPNFQRRFVEEGLRFSNSFVTNPLCCPSRATFLTGQYNHNNGVLSVLGGTENDPFSGGLAYWLNSDGTPRDELNTIATWLQKAGYRTGHVGKYLNGYGLDTPPTYVPAGYDDWQALIDPDTYVMYDYPLSNNGVVEYYGSTPADYKTDVLARKALAFLEGSEGSATRPFSLFLKPNAPHLGTDEAVTLRRALQDYAGIDRFNHGVVPAPRHAHLADGNPANGEIQNRPLKGSVDETEMSDKLRVLQDLRAVTPDDKAKLQIQHKQIVASLMAVDDMIGAVVDRLAQKGVLERTILLFTSDNGFFFGEHKLTHKNWPYEEASRVPLYFRLPGLPGGRTSTRLVSNNDLAPTLAELTGAVPERIVDGFSLVPLLREAAAPWARRQLMIQHFQVSAEHWANPTTYVALRELHEGANRLHIRFLASKRDLSGETIGWETYDLAKDPLQLDGTPKGGSVEAAMARTLDLLRTCSGDSCRSAESRPIHGDSQWYVRDHNQGGAPDYPIFEYGSLGWIPLSGDWDGDGRDSIGMFRPSDAVWFLRRTVGPGVPDAAPPFQYGGSGWLPVVGDWDGDGRDSIGLYHPAAATWYLRNSNSGGAPDVAPFAYGVPAWLPVAGDWDGDGRDSIGICDPSSGICHVRNENDAGAPDDALPFAAGPGAVPIAGKVAGRDAIFTFSKATGRWTLPPSAGGEVFGYGGVGWAPVIGDWNGDGTDTIGVVDNVE